MQPSDLLQISVWREPELTQQVLVRPDGAFSFPLAGDVSAIGKTVEEFRRINPDYLITGHCTGDRFYDLALEALGEKVIHSAVGTRFVFGKL